MNNGYIASLVAAVVANNRGITKKRNNINRPWVFNEQLKSGGHLSKTKKYYASLDEKKNKVRRRMEAKSRAINRKH